ncbi:MAG: ribosomal-processing cysteine protease Prp [Armatimonadetes bacterium]|nr:ribosomal-processing cysteine protease Prp [Armatimonadota bacterium]
MIQLRLRRDSRERVCELDCRGHAGFDDGTGIDLVCAGVSAVLGALAIGLTEVAALPIPIDAGDGAFHVRIPEHLDPDQQRQAALLMETAARALLALDTHYRGYLQVDWLEPRQEFGSAPE